MVQTESGRIRQLSKGCCFMEWALLFLISMLIFSTVVQTVFACDCKEIDWAQQFCRHDDKTVLLASIVDVSTVGRDSCFTMMYQRIFNLGSSNITFGTNNTFEMVKPYECSPTFIPSTMYLIYGDANKDGVLQSSSSKIECMTL